jgi:hypothetical protein
VISARACVSVGMSTAPDGSPSKTVSIRF